MKSFFGAVMGEVLDRGPETGNGAPGMARRLVSFLSGARNGRSASDFSLAAEADFLGQLLALFGIAGRDHRVIRLQAPFGAIVIGRHPVGRHQMALEHLQFFAVFQTNDEIIRHRFLDRNSGGRRLYNLFFGFGEFFEFAVNDLDQRWNIRCSNRVVGDMGGDNLRCQSEDFRLIDFGCFCHVVCAF